MPPVTDDAVCLREWEWSETSQTASLFTRRHGLIRVIAKGSRRPKAPFSGGLELLTMGRATFYPKAEAGLLVLGAWDLVDPCPHLRRSLDASRSAVFIAEIVQMIMTDADPHPRLFDAVDSAIAALAEPVNHMATLLRFQMLALDEAGYRPTLDRDVLRQGEPLPETEVVRFSPSAGGLTADDGASGALTWRIRLETVELLRLAQDDAPLTDAPLDTLDRANRLLVAYLTHLMSRRPQSARALFPDTPGHDGPALG